MVKLGPLDCCADEVAGDALATQCFGDTGMNQNQTVASASIDQLSFSPVLRPNEAVVSRVAHNPMVRLLTGHDAQVHLPKSNTSRAAVMDINGGRTRGTRGLR